MPDGRLRDATAYSTNPSTVAGRRRLLAMSPRRRAQLRDQQVEYQAIWQLLQRVSKKADYKRASRATQRVMLENACENLMKKRQVPSAPTVLRDGKTMCETNQESMIDRHLKKEASMRTCLRRAPGQPGESIAFPSLKGIAIDPSPHAQGATPPHTPIDVDGLDDGRFTTPGGAGGDYGEEGDVLFHTKNEEDQEFDRDLDARLRGHPSAGTVRQINTLLAEVTSLKATVLSIQAEQAALKQRVQGLENARGGGSAAGDGSEEGEGGVLYGDSSYQQAREQSAAGGYAMYPYGKHPQFHQAVWQQQQAQHHRFQQLQQQQQMPFVPHFPMQQYGPSPYMAQMAQMAQHQQHEHQQEQEQAADGQHDAEGEPHDDDHDADGDGEEEEEGGGPADSEGQPWGQ